jgi:P-type E1-E2 ATPase
MAAALEDGTRHPLARAIRDAADAVSAESGDGAPVPAVDDVRFADVRTVAGAGVCGTLASARSACAAEGVSGQTVAVGNRAMLDAVGASASKALHALQEEAEEQGRTALYVAEGGRAVGVITLEERITEGARSAVKALQDAGLQLSVITGDQPEAGRRLHEELGVSVQASVSPEEKVQHVRDAQTGRGAVGLVGDGINDAAAIAEADIGIARTSGAGVSIEAADIALYNPNLEILSDLFALARRTRRIIHQNLWWTFGYNAIGLGLAVAGLLHPIAAVIVMATSSAFVTWNAFRIRTNNSTP